MRDSADSGDYGVTRRGKGGKSKKRGRFYDDESDFAKRDRHLPRPAAEDAGDATDGLPEGDRWSTWDQSTPTERGPRPHPELAGHRTRRGRHRTRHTEDRQGSRRLPAPPPRARPGRSACSPPSGTATPGTGCSTGTPATRRAGAQGEPGQPGDGKPDRVRHGDDRRAVGGRRVHRAVPAARCRDAVPYPAQITGTECCSSSSGSDGTAAPRLAETRPGEKLLPASGSSSGA